MSVFSNLVAACVEQGSLDVLVRDCKSVYVLEEEHPLYSFVMEHANRYGRLPSMDTLRTAGHRLRTPNENAAYYMDRLKQRYVYNIINDRHPMLRQALQDRDSGEAMAVLRQMVELGSMVAQTEGVTSLATEASLVAQEMMRRKFVSGLVGVTTGWDTLDRVTLGYMGGDVIVLAGRPSMGKSWLLNESLFSAWESGKSVLLVSMEMGKQQMVRRWMGRHLGINPNYIRQGQVNSWAEGHILNYADTVSTLPRVSLVAGDMSKEVDGIEAAVAEHNPDIIGVDAAYLLTPSGKDNRGIAKWEAIGKVIGQLKKISIRYDRPVKATVQFNRQVKNNSTKELDLGDIGGSDSIPQDASIVLGARIGLSPYEKSRRRVQVMKNREGDVCEFHTDFSFAPPRMCEVYPEIEDEENVEWMA